MHGFIALYLIACLDPTNHNTCVSLPVTDSTQAQPDGSEMSIMGCMGIEGANSAKKFWEDHPDMHKAYGTFATRCFWTSLPSRSTFC
jgi:hypothetical protein